MFDARFAGRWLAMHRSLAAHMPGARICAACLDDASRAIVERLRLPGVTTLTFTEVEAGDPGLAVAARERHSLPRYAEWLADLLGSLDRDLVGAEPP